MSEAVIHLGDIEIALLDDGIVHVDAGGLFGLVPRALFQSILKPDDNNLIPMALTCLLVRAYGKTIVVDTGLGRKLPDKIMRQWNIVRPHGDLHDQLAQHGVQAADVDIVIDTHLHYDHCGGNTVYHTDRDTVVPAFPNAQYVTQRREYEEAMQPNERTRATYFPYNYQPLVESGQMRLLESDGEITQGIHGLITPGHTPAHMCIHFESNGQHALFMADLASYAVHFERLGWMTAYDVEPLRTLETKRRIHMWAQERDALLIFQHDPRIRTARLTRQLGKYEILPELLMEP